MAERSESNGGLFQKLDALLRSSTSSQARDMELRSLLQPCRMFWRSGRRPASVIPIRRKMRLTSR